jgi:hypothetical protein
VAPVRLVPEDSMFSPKISGQATVKTNIDENKVKRSIKESHFDLSGRKIPSY